MRTTRIYQAVAIYVATIAVIMVAHRSDAQDPSATKQCPVSEVSSPSRSLHIPETGNCDEVAKVFRSAMEDFFVGQCATLEARRNALDPSTYGQANEALKAASGAFARSGSTFGLLAKLIAPTSLPISDEHYPAETILGFYGHKTPATDREAYELLANVMALAADEISNVAIGSDGDLTSIRKETFGLDGALVRPGGVFHAITALFSQSGA